MTRVQATGDLTIHGAAKRVTIPLEVKASGSQVEVLGSLTFPFADFGMSAPNVGGLVTVESNPTWSSSWCSSGQRDYLLYISSLSSSNVV